MQRNTLVVSLLLAVGLLLTGCFRSAGPPTLPATIVGQSDETAAEPTATDVPPTAAATATATPTRQPSATPAAATSTPAEAPDTATSAPPTETPVPPTATSTPAPPTATETPLPPTATATASVTPALPTETATVAEVASGGSSPPQSVEVDDTPSDALRSPTPVVHVIERVITATPGGSSECPPCVCPECPECLECPVDTEDGRPDVNSPQVVEPTAEPTAELAAPEPTVAELVPPTAAPGCPPLVPEMSLSPKLPSLDLRDIPAQIDFFLSDGGTVEQLETGLRGWEVLVEESSIVQGQFDGESGSELAMAMSSREAYNVWVFDCQGNVLFQAFPAANEQPVGLSFVELDGDVSTAELFYGLETCDAAGCRTAWHAIEWVGPHPGAVNDLFARLPVFRPNFSGLEFIDQGAGSPVALRFTEGASDAPSHPPSRDIVYTYTLTGTVYVETVAEYTPPVYRHQMIRAGDDAIGVDNALAIERYWASIFDPDLLVWPSNATGEAYNAVNAFARYRVIQLALLTGDNLAASQTANDLQALYGASAGGAEIARLGEALYLTYTNLSAVGGDSPQARMHAACLSIGALDTVFSPAYQAAQRFGFITETAELCPF